jgi:hypothetical protein
VSANDASIVAQFTSLGSVQPKRLADFMAWLVSNRARFCIESSVQPTDQLELVLPTMYQIEMWGRELDSEARASETRPNVH